MARAYWCCYFSYEDIMEDLTDTQRGRIFTAVMAYATRGEMPNMLDGEERIAFKVIKGQIDRDNAKYEQTCDARTQAANKRWHGSDDTSDDADTCKSMQMHANAYKEKDIENENDIESERERASDSESERVCKRERATARHTHTQHISFQPPTEEEVAAYCAEKKYGVDTKKFFYHYTANGWQYGKSPMRDWRAAVDAWERNDTLALYGNTATGKPKPYQGFEQRANAAEDFNKLVDEISLKFD